MKSFAAVSWLPRLCTKIPLAFQMSSHKDCSKSLIWIIWTEWLFNLSRKDGGQSGKVLSRPEFCLPCSHESVAYVCLYHLISLTLLIWKNDGMLGAVPSSAGPACSHCSLATWPRDKANPWMQPHTPNLKCRSIMERYGEEEVAQIPSDIKTEQWPA